MKRLILLLFFCPTLLWAETFRFDLLDLTTFQNNIKLQPTQRVVGQITIYNDVIHLLDYSNNFDVYFQMLEVSNTQRLPNGLVGFSILARDKNYTECLFTIINENNQPYISIDLGDGIILIYRVTQ